MKFEIIAQIRNHTHTHTVCVSVLWMILWMVEIFFYEGETRIVMRGSDHNGFSIDWFTP